MQYKFSTYLNDSWFWRKQKCLKYLSALYDFTTTNFFVHFCKENNKTLSFSGLEQN